MFIAVLPKIPLGEGLEWLIRWLIKHFSVLLDSISDGLQNTTDYLVNGLLWINPFVFIAILAGLFWLLTSKRIAIFSALSLLLIYDLALWEPLINTIILILIAVAIALVIGIPVGIFMTRSQTAYKIIRPLLDFMQTMPPFVYLIPAVMLFGIGVVPGLFATIIFAIPPPVRLTHLGITQVPEDMKEMARAFGARDIQVLLKVELPLSRPSLMAGVNQCIMLGISMVVIASMIGAGGLGSEVMRALSRVDMAHGFEGGLAIVILAMMMDSVSRYMGENNENLLSKIIKSIKSLLKKQFGNRKGVIRAQP